jgi:hypothetical protein
MSKLLAAIAVVACAAGVAAALAIDRAPAATDRRDAERGVSARVPAGWHAAAKLTALAFPRELVTIASSPLQRGGSCGPTRALRDLRANDALVTVVEYSPPRGLRAPPRPRRLRLPERRPAGALECFGVPGDVLAFRDHGRDLQVVVVLGERAGAARRREVERVLDGLRFDARLALRRRPYLGVRCPVANSLSCDRAGLAVWLRHPARRLTATIGGRRLELHPPDRADGFWEGTLRDAGFLRPGSPLRVRPDRDEHWQGRDPPRVVVHLTAVGADGAGAVGDVTTTLRAGYG